MAKKLKTVLPRNFQKLVDSGDVEAMKKAFEGRSLEATNPYGRTVLHHTSVPTELKIWLLEQGADVNVHDAEGKTPLHSHASIWEGDVGFLLDRGADVQAVNDRGENVAYTAVFFVENLRTLIAAGADPYLRNNKGEAPLMRVLRRGNTGQLPEIAELVRLLGDNPFTCEEWEEARRLIINLGRRFAEIREAYEEDSVEQATAGMVFLYDTFDIPADQRATEPIRHDGSTPIELEGDTWGECFTNAWDFLVPVTGKALTLQGEAIRIAGRVANEFHGNGGINWDADFQRMASALLDITEQGVTLGPKDRTELKKAITDVCGGTPADDSVDALPRLATAWVLHNPQPLPGGEIDYRR